MSYKTGARFFCTKTERKRSRAGIVFNRLLVIDGRIEGSWKPTIVKKSTEITLAPFSPLNKVKKQKAQQAINRYLKFHSANRTS